MLTISVWAALLAGSVASGLSRALADGVEQIAALARTSKGAHATAVVAGYVGILTLMGRTAVLPLSWYRDFALERRFGVSRRRWVDWLRGYAQTTIAHAAAWAAAAALLYAAIRGWPTWWWLIVSLAFAVLTLAATHVAPVMTAPRLYHVRPLRRPGLRRRLDALVRRAGAPAIAIREWKTGADAPRANAALVGIGLTRRVLLTETLLADYSDDEIEVVVAHELAHHAHGDAWKTLAFKAVAAALSCGGAQWALHRFGPSLGLAGLADVAGLPVAALAGGSVVMLLRPVSNLLSRRLERRADRYALALTGKPDALVSGLRRLAAQSLAEERPSRVTEWLFHSHPPWSDRLMAARSAPAGDGPAAVR